MKVDRGGSRYHGAMKNGMKKEEWLRCAVIEHE
jgi:hypothetical protein